MWDLLVKTWNYDPFLRISLLSLASILLQLKTLEPNSMSVLGSNQTSTKHNNSNNSSFSNSSFNVTSPKVNTHFDTIKEEQNSTPSPNTRLNSTTSGRSGSKHKAIR
eukprot:jgi/Orpsp1_1/1187388/evm.model.d7180000057344.1